TIIRCIYSSFHMPIGKNARMKAGYHPSIASMTPNRRVTWQATSNDEILSHARRRGSRVAARGARAAAGADAADRDSDAVPADKRRNAGARARLSGGTAETWLGGQRQRPVRRALDQRQHGPHSFRR